MIDRRDAEDLTERLACFIGAIMEDASDRAAKAFGDRPGTVTGQATDLLEASDDVQVLARALAVVAIRVDGR